MTKYRRSIYVLKEHCSYKKSDIIATQDITINKFVKTGDTSQTSYPNPVDIAIDLGRTWDERHSLQHNNVQ